MRATNGAKRIALYTEAWLTRRSSPPRSWGRSTVQTACPLDCPDCCSLAVTVERGTRRRRSTAARARRRPTATSAARSGGSIGASTATSAFCIRRCARARRARASSRASRGTKRSISSRTRCARRAIAFGAESVLPYHYGGSNGLLTNDLEDARFFRRFGASRLARTVCAAPTGAAATAMYGKMAGVAYADYEARAAHRRLGLQSVGVRHPSRLAHQEGAEERRAARRDRSAPHAARATGRSAPAPCGPGTDLPVALAIIRELFERGWADEAFLAEHATGVDELRAAAEPWTIERAAAEAGVAAGRSRDASPSGTARRLPAVIRCGWGQERNRNGGVGDDGDPRAAGRRRKVRRARRRLHDEQLRRVGHHGRDADRRARAAPTRVVNMNQLGRALTEYRRSAGVGAVRLQLQPARDRARSEPRAAGPRARGSVHRRATNRS